MKIRMRAWDTISKDMFFWGFGPNKNDAHWVGPPQASQPDRFIHMLSTGLHDKNGVEIFEGDRVRFIAEFSTGFDACGNERIEEEEYTAIVKWDVAGFIIQTDLDSPYNYAPLFAIFENVDEDDIMQTEVVGHIYEGE